LIVCFLKWVDPIFSLYFLDMGLDLHDSKCE
jgi:hypothetical protein